jgi:hypothetical protein
MSKKMLSEEQLETAYNRFLAEHPEVSVRVKAITLESADALGVDLRDLRRVEVAKALEEFAASCGLDVFEYLLGYAVETQSERQKIMHSRREAIEQAIGLR